MPDSIKAEQLRLLYEAVPIALFAILVNATVTVAVLWGQVPELQLLAWLGAIFAMTAARYMVTRRYLAQIPDPHTTTDWPTLFYLGFIASALLWGGSVFFIFPLDSPAHQILLTLMIAGTCAGAVSTLSYQWRAIALFLVLTLVPVILRFVILGDALSLAVAFMASFFLAMLLASSHRIYQTNQTNLLLREEAKASEVRFRNLLQATPDALFIVDDAGRIEFLNRRGVELFGYGEDELRGQPVDTLVPPDQRTQHSQHRVGFSNGGPDQPMKANRNVFARRKDGSEFPADITLSRVAFSGSMHTCAAVRDVTERWQIEEALRGAKIAAEAANQAKSSFLSAMSHELRTPLNAILGFSQLMRDDPNLTLTQQDNIAEILISGEYLLKLVNDVLDLSKVEAGCMQLSVEQVQVGDLLDSCIAMIEPIARQHGIAIGTQIGACSNALVLADRTRLLQILLNLMSNAVKYNREHGSVSLACEHRPDNWLRFSVTDTGPGISPEKQRELFVPFSRLGKEFSNIEGTGIGLALSKQIVELMDGELGVSSVLGQGSNFWLDLPYVGETGAPTIDAARVIGQAPILDKVTVLYIEDNPVNQQALGQMLAGNRQYRLLLAGDPLFGLQMAREAKPDVLLMDIDMPDMNGFQAAEQMKTDPATRHIPIIAVTAWHMNESPTLLEQAQFAGLIAKPFDKRLLLIAIGRALGRDNIQHQP